MRPRNRPEPIDTNMSRSRSKSPIIRSSTPKSNLSRSKSPTAAFMSSTPKSNRSISSKILQPFKSISKNPILESREKVKVMTLCGLVEPKTPPGLPPYIRPTIKRPTIKKLVKQANII